VTDDDLLEIIETDYRSSHMYWIEKRLNKRLETWFRKTDEIEIDDLLAKQKINDLQVEVFAFYNKSDYEPVTRLSAEAYQSWISSIVTGWAVRKSVSVWSKIKMASRHHKNNAVI
tara:strand:- start:107 stop:451 length:345 start_codon:yes stop_codon:yes gene_type:complete